MGISFCTVRGEGGKSYLGSIFSAASLLKVRFRASTEILVILFRPAKDLELSEKLKFYSEFFMVWSSF